MAGVMEALNGKLIIYDGGCPLCICLRDKMLRFNIFPEQSMVNYYELAPDLQSKVEADRFRNEMALIDTKGGPTIYGAEGIAYLFSSKYALVKGLLAIPGMRTCFEFAYKTLAFNRYFVATPNKAMPICDCQPTIPLTFQISYGIWNALIATFVTFGFGASLTLPLEKLTRWEGGIGMLLIAGTGWILMAALAFLLRMPNRAKYIPHMMTVMRKGVMPLLFFILAVLLFGIEGYWLPLIVVLYSSLMMTRQHYLRIWQIGLGQKWTLLWLLCLQSTALMWIYLLLYVLK
jgi:hypothetical protein